MFNLFNKGPKVRAGKQNNQEEKKKTAAVGLTGGKTPRPADVLGEAWKKLQKMDRKQAYTWGGIAVVALVALISIASMGGQDAEDFTDFETRGYDLANMPFSTDEAEQYLLASKYPDMNDKAHSGLYSEAEKEARQAEDAAEAQAQLDKSASSSGSEYRPNRYYGGGGSRGGGAASPTQVGSLNSAGLKSASGSGMKSTFGPQGDFSNFRSQEKGKDKFVPSGPGKGNARTALIQTAQASRAAAGLKNDKLLNAKKAMMGGNVKGSDAFLDDSGAVNLGAAKGLELDTNAPISSADLSGLGDALQDANQEAAAEDQQEEEDEWLTDLLVDIGKMVAQELISFGMDSWRNAAGAARAAKLEQAQVDQEIYKEWNGQFNEKVNMVMSPGSPVDASLLSHPTYGENFQKAMGYEVRGNQIVSVHNSTGTEEITVVGSMNADGDWSWNENADTTLSRRAAANLNKKNMNTWGNLPGNEGIYNGYLQRSNQAYISGKQSYYNLRGSSGGDRRGSRGGNVQKGDIREIEGVRKQWDGFDWVEIEED